MITQAKDYRSKIISFRPSLAGLEIASQQGILWPCHAFKVSIPTRRKKVLNIFEETILKLYATKQYDTQKLAEVACLDKEIVIFIQYRLVQLDILSDRFELTKLAKELLNQLDNEPEEYMAATVYVDLIGGSILPIVTSEDPKYENVTEHRNQQGYIEFTVGSTGKKKNISALQLLPERNHMSMRPLPDEIAKTIRAFKRLHKRFSLLTENNIGLPSFFQNSEAITIHQKPEVVFLHCRVIIQKGNPDFLVTDAFGYGFSNILKEALSDKSKADKTLNNWLVRLKGRGVIQKIADEEVDNTSPNEKLPDGFSNVLFQYSDIKNRLNFAELKYKKVKNLQPSSTNRVDEEKQLMSGCLKALYDALEWTFRQVVFDNPVDHWADIFSSQSYKDNDRLLHKFVEKIGFTVHRSGNSLLQIKPGKIRAYLDGTVEMQPLLALAIAGASQDNQHPINNLALNDCNSLSFIAKLKRLRDIITHGEELNYTEIMQATSWMCVKCKKVYHLIDEIKKCPNCNHEEMKVTTTVFDDYRKRTHQIIISLYPSLKSTSGAAKTDISVGMGDIDQLRLKARISLDSYYGLSVVQMMPRNLSDELTKIELFGEALSIESSKIPEYVNSLASVLQISLLFLLAEHKVEIGDDIDLKVLALEKANIVKFSLIDETFPQGLRTVKNNSVKQACGGSSSTLGANLLAFLILIPKETLVTISRNVPNLITLVARIIDLRGHANKSSEQILNELDGENELLALKETVYDTVNTLMEI